MSVEYNLPIVRERKLAIQTGDPERVAEQKKLGKMTARERIGLLFDKASFVELDALVGRDGESGVVTGYGLIDGRPACVYAQDYTVMGGAVGAEHARKVIKVMDLAAKTGAPVVALFDSMGVRLKEGVDAVNAYASISAKTAQLSGVVPQIAVVLGQCAASAGNPFFRRHVRRKKILLSPQTCERSECDAEGCNPSRKRWRFRDV